MEKSSPIDYKDTYLILFTLPVISFLNYHLTYSAIRWDVFFFATYAIDTLEGYAGWWAGRAVIIFFDKKLPWEHNLVKRLLIQLPVVAIVVIGVVSILTELVNFIATDKPLPLSYYTQNVLIFFIWTIFLNFLYLSIYFFRRYQQKNEKVEAVRQDLLVKIGTQQKRVDIKDFKLFYVSNDIVYGCTSEGKLPMAGYTLDRLEKSLDTTLFFRANRQCIITREMIDVIRREENGKLAVNLKNNADLKGPLMISRLRASAFKKWMSS